jgi:hypothetical protein
MNVLLFLLLLISALLIGDIFVILWHVGIDEYLAPLYVHRIPGGAMYWFLVKKAKA